GREVRGVAVGACYVVAPVFAAFEIIVLFFAGVAFQAAFGDLLRRFVCECPNLGFVSAAFHVRLAGSVTRFAALLLSFPAGLLQLGVRRLHEALVLCLVTGLASFAANVILGRVLGGRRGWSLLLV